MHFFNNRFKPFFDIRDTRAQSKRFNLNKRLQNVLMRDVLDAIVHRKEFNYYV